MGNVLCGCECGKYVWGRMRVLEVGYEGMTGVQGGSLLPQTPLTKSKNDTLNTCLPDRALGSSGPILLHDQVEAGVVPLSFGESLVSP